MLMIVKLHDRAFDGDGSIVDSKNDKYTVQETAAEMVNLQMLHTESDHDLRWLL